MNPRINSFTLGHTDYLRVPEISGGVREEGRDKCFNFAYEGMIYQIAVGDT